MENPHIPTDADFSKKRVLPDRNQFWYINDAEFAHASNDGSYIGLNPRWFGHPDELLTKRGECVRDGWHPQGADDIKSIITHEVGHLIGHAIYMSDKFMEYINFLDTNYYQRKDISKYAMYNDSEAWADSFVIMQIRPKEDWPVYTQQQALFLDRLIGELK